MASDFRLLGTAQQLATALSVDAALISNFLDAPDPFLERVQIPRRHSSRAPREAWKVVDTDAKSMLVSVRIALDEFLREAFRSRYPHPCVHGYVTGGSAFKNAAVHAGRRRLLCVDVIDFFPSITRTTVNDALLRFELTAEGAEILSRLITRNDSLPLGYPTSPLFSNIVMNDVDHRLQKLAVHVGATYTRYADDLTFSSDARVPTIAEVADVLRAIGLSIHPSKSHEKKRGQALYVTGFSVSDAVPHAPRPMKRRLRTELHFIKTFGLANHVDHLKRGSVVAECDRIVGLINHVRQADAVAADILLAEWNARPPDGDGVITRQPRQRTTPLTLLFDDSSFKFFSEEYRAVGTVLLRDVAKTRARIKAKIIELALHPLMQERARKAVIKKGLHYADLPEDFRRDAVELVRELPARAHIVFDGAHDSKKAQMAVLLRTSLRWRLSQCRGRVVEVVFEEGEYIKRDSAKALVDEVVNALPDAEKPLRVDHVRVVAKSDEPCVALPDIFLGAWQQLACAHEPDRKEHHERDGRLFRSLQRQLGTVYRPSTKELFTSRKPFEGLPPPPARPSMPSTPAEGGPSVPPAAGNDDAASG